MDKMVNLDTNFFYAAFEEWKLENDCPLADYNDLRLDDRSRIMIRAQELKRQLAMFLR